MPNSGIPHTDSKIHLPSSSSSSSFCRRISCQTLPVSPVSLRINRMISFWFIRIYFHLLASQAWHPTDDAFTDRWEIPLLYLSPLWGDVKFVVSDVRGAGVCLPVQMLLPGKQRQEVAANSWMSFKAPCCAALIRSRAAARHHNDISWQEQEASGRVSLPQINFRFYFFGSDSLVFGLNFRVGAALRDLF